MLESYLPTKKTGVGNLSNCSSDICCLCCPTMEFCGISTGIDELMVDGLLANICIGIVPLFCTSSLVKEVPVPIARGTDSVSLRVSCAVAPSVTP